MKIVFATHNPNKVKEVQALLPDFIELLSLSDIDCNEDIPETADTIAGNALQKAIYVKENYGYNCFADDTGLEVTALKGAPGIYSARYAGSQKNDSDNVDKLLKNMKNESDQSAQFKTVIALVTDNEKETFTGICKGKILSELRGENGFGYDPVFQPEGFLESFAEMEAAQKNKISHRAKALKKLIASLQSK